MTIPFTKYVDIQSGVGGGASVATRDLIGRILTDNPLTPADAPLEFTSASEVLSYYGAGTEADIASFYFGYVSPRTSKARRISYGRYSPSGSSARLLGGTAVKPLAPFVAITSGGLALTVDGAPLSVTGIDLSAATSLSAVATTIQTAVAATTPLANATVAYDAQTRRFTLTAAGLSTVRVELASDTPLSNLLQWGAGQAIVSPAVQPQSAAQAFVDTVDASNNFGSVAFYPPLALDDAVDVAELVAGENVRYMLMVPVSRADAITWGVTLSGFAGTAVTLSPVSGQYPELVPMIQLAATDYNARNGVVNYMFKTFAGLTASVTTGLESDTFDAVRVNYYGLTKTAGQNIQFYQRGFLMGGPTAPVDMNVFGNEMWLKDYMGSQLMALLLGAGRVPANETGRGQILSVVQGGIDQALLNGTISVGKLLSAQKKADITETTGDPLSWQQVEQMGYWVNAAIVEEPGPSGTSEFKAVYVVIYSKDDAVRAIQGTHVLQ